MKSRWMWILAVCFLLAGAASVQAEPMAELTASYSAIFLSDAEPGEPVDPIEGEFAEYIHCCASSGSCIVTTQIKCTRTYSGTVHGSQLECRQAGCTS